MRNIFNISTLLRMNALTLTLLLASCKDGQFQGIEDFVKEETIYSSAYTFARKGLGYERVEIYMEKETLNTVIGAEQGSSSGRKWPSASYMANAVKTVVFYDDKRLDIDKVCDTINIVGLTEARLYRFKIHSADAWGNLSKPYEVTQIPFVKADLDKMALESQPDIAATAAGTATVKWDFIVSEDYNYKWLEYSYPDRNGTEVTGENRTNRPSVTMSNLKTGATTTLHLILHVIPKVSGTPILDIVPIEADIDVVVP
jgi:hypothetical protein